MHILVDLLIIGILAFCAWQGYRRGVIGGILAVVFVVVAIYGANLVATTYSNEFADMFRPFVSGYLDRVETEAIEEHAPPELASLSTEDLFRLDPGIEPEMAETVFLALGAHESRTYKLHYRYEAERFEGHTVNRAMTNVLVYAFCFLIIYVIAFLLLLIGFTVVYNIIPFSFRLPGHKLKLPDEIGGAVFGLGQGLLMVFMLTWLLGYLGLPLSRLAEGLLERTWLTEFFVRANPMTNWISL